jgi:hypothetical protein
MLGRVFAGFVVTFWLVTMASLVRLEFFPKPLPMDTVPSTRVLRKIFSNPEPARLGVFYRNMPIGDCSVEITPLAETDSTHGPTSGRKPNAYRVKSKLTMTLSVFGLPSRVHLKGDSVFDSNYMIQSFDITTRIKDGRVHVSGDKKAGKVNVEVVMGEVSEQRSFGFDQVQGTGLASALGLPGLTDFGFLGGGGYGAAGSSGNSRGLPFTTTSFDRLTIGSGTVPAYLIESRLDGGMWAKMWVDEAGDILLVDTSIGLRMEDYHLQKTSNADWQNVANTPVHRWRSTGQ